MSFLQQNLFQNHTKIQQFNSTIDINCLNWQKHHNLNDTLNKRVCSVNAKYLSSEQILHYNSQLEQQNNTINLVSNDFQSHYHDYPDRKKNINAYYSDIEENELLFGNSGLFEESDNINNI